LQRQDLKRLVYREAGCCLGNEKCFIRERISVRALEISQHNRLNKTGGWPAGKLRIGQKCYGYNLEIMSVGFNYIPEDLFTSL
jgi:hypothetical protein